MIKVEDEKKDLVIEERISLLEAQVEYLSTQSPNVPIRQKLLNIVTRVLCRENLELFLSISSLVVSALVAAYILYYR